MINQKTVSYVIQNRKQCKPYGRPTGAKGKPIKDKLENLLKKNFRIIEKDLKTAAPEVRRDFFVKLAAVVVKDSDTNSVSNLLNGNHHA